MFSFGYLEAGYWHHVSSPTRFYAAPFWGDVNIEDGGDILYETHTAPSVLTEQVSSFVSWHEGIEFSATWMTIAYWIAVQQFGYATPNVSQRMCIKFAEVYVILFITGQHIPRNNFD